MSERVLEPLEMSDTEIVEFIATNCLAVQWMGGASSRTLFGWQVTIDTGKNITAPTFENAIGLAKAIYDKEAMA